MQNKKWMLLIAGLLTALLVVGIVGATHAYAQSGGPGWPGHGPKGGHTLSQAELDAAAKVLGMTSDELSTALQGGKTLQQIATEKNVDIQTVMQAIQAVRPPRLGQTELAAAAQALNMTTTDLSTAFQSGKTLQQLATEKGVDLQKVNDAITAAHREEVRTQIKQAVTDGTLTQAKADWLLEGLDKGYLDGPGFGFGFGFGPHGRGFDNQPKQQSLAVTATP